MMILQVTKGQPEEEPDTIKEMRAVVIWLYRITNLVNLAEQSTSADELRLFIDALEECESAFIAEHPDWNPLWRAREAIRLRKGDYARVYDRARVLGVEI